MPGDEFARILRHDKKRARLGHKPSCTRCGETDIRTLQESEGKVLCADCRLEVQGKTPFERHHPAGAQNDPFTVEISANEHAVLSDMQEDWPVETRMNRNKSSLLSLAASQRAASDTLRRQAERLRELARLVEDLHRFNNREIGEGWEDRFVEFRKRRPR